MVTDCVTGGLNVNALLDGRAVNAIDEFVQMEHCIMTLLLQPIQLIRKECVAVMGRATSPQALVIVSKAIQVPIASNHPVQEIVVGMESA